MSPNDPLPDPSPLVEGVLKLMEESNVPQAVADHVVETIEAWETIVQTPYYQQKEHPEGYEGPCACDECLSCAATS